jgi:methylase of polypeptide subunit release factors
MTAVLESPVTHEPTPSPLRLEPASSFEALRSFLQVAAYDDAEICRRLDIDSIDHFRAIRDGRPDVPPQDAIDVMIRLFLDNEAMPWSAVRAVLPADVVMALHTLGLLRDHRTDTQLAVANVLMYPTHSLYLASDAVAIPDGESSRWWDLVYAAITTNTRNFLSTMPTTRSQAFLDLCSGTGIAALIAARDFADHAWAVDVAERSTAFARFNAKLNGIENVTMLAGDLYEPVAGLTFDRIVAHPPYVPSRETRMVYRDGGSDGEGITRRIIAGLPDHLRPGGQFHCTCTATDRRDAPLEQRLRAMLGPAANEFDIAVIVTNEYDPTEYYVRLAIAGRSTWAEAEEWHRHFAALGVTKMVYATIAMVRQTRPHEPFTVRRRVGSSTTPAHLDRLVHAAEVTASPEALERLLSQRPAIPAHVALHTDHARDSGGWVMRTATLSTSVPLDVRVPCPSGMVSILGGMDGSRTVRELYADLADADSLTADATIETLASYVHMLAAHGLVELHDAAR